MAKAGSLRSLLAFEERIMESDGAGNEQGPFVERFRVPAEVRNGRGSETVLANRLEGIQPVTITVRQSSQTRMIRSDWRARDVRTGEVYALRSPAADPAHGKGAWLEMVAASGVAT